MKINDFINPEYLDPQALSKAYKDNPPFPHIVMKNFINAQLLDSVLSEFPNLESVDHKAEFSNERSIKLASIGFKDVSNSASKLISFLNSDIFLTYLNQLTGIEEKLLSDPYLSGGGYHEIKHGGHLKVHADFNKHPDFNLDRRLNLLIYLNKDWDDEWGGSLELYDENELNKPAISIKPEFNTCVIFTTTSFTYHGHPDPLNCPTDKSRKSLALYYFSFGRPRSENAGEHSTMFVQTKGENFQTKQYSFRSLLIDFSPPILYRNVKRLLRKIKH